MLATIVVIFGPLDVIKPLLSSRANVSSFVSGLISVIFISGGTEGFNSLVKWVTWKKEEAKAQAAGRPSKAAAKAMGA